MSLATSTGTAEEQNKLLHVISDNVINITALEQNNYYSSTVTANAIQSTVEPIVQFDPNLFPFHLKYYYSVHELFPFCNFL